MGRVTTNVKVEPSVACCDLVPYQVCWLIIDLDKALDHVVDLHKMLSLIFWKMMQSKWVHGIPTNEITHITNGYELEKNQGQIWGLQIWGPQFNCYVCFHFAVSHNFCLRYMKFDIWAWKFQGPVHVQGKNCWINLCRISDMFVFHFTGHERTGPYKKVQIWWKMKWTFFYDAHGVLIYRCYTSKSCSCKCQILHHGCALKRERWAS